MSDREDYYRKARSWSEDVLASSGRSQRRAWLVAGIATAVALFEAVALAMLTPLKTVQPVTVLVDKQTGYVTALDPTKPRIVRGDQALTDAFLAQYVLAREGFDRATVQTDYRRVALWSAGPARASYLSEIQATNPASPFQRYPAGSLVLARVKSVSRVNEGAAFVRFETQLQDRSGTLTWPTPYIAYVRFRYVDAPMRLEDRLVNPLGFQVFAYRRDQEALPPVPVAEPPAVNNAPVVAYPARPAQRPGAPVQLRTQPQPQAVAPAPVAPAPAVRVQGTR